MRAALDTTAPTGINSCVAMQAHGAIRLGRAIDPRADSFWSSRTTRARALFTQILVDQG